MKVVEIAFVNYAVKNLPKAQKFYEDVLGLKPTSKWVQSDTSGMIEYDIGPGTLAIGAGAPNFVPGKQGPTAAVEVEDFDAAVKQLKVAKIKFNIEPMETPVCWMAMVEDPDGNNLIIHHRKKK